eukprot:1774723-Amphidinium_carterae.1
MAASSSRWTFTRNGSDTSSMAPTFRASRTLNMISCEGKRCSDKCSLAVTSVGGLRFSDHLFSMPFKVFTGTRWPPPL